MNSYKVAPTSEAQYPETYASAVIVNAEKTSSYCAEETPFASGARGEEGGVEA